MQTQAYEQQTWAPAWLVVIHITLESDPQSADRPTSFSRVSFPACKTQHAGQWV